MASLVLDDEQSDQPALEEEDEISQSEELEVLESIYPDKLRINPGSVLPSFDCVVDVSLVHTLTPIKAYFFNPEDGREPIAGPFDINYLTPVHMKCSFPRDYPSVSPPSFSLKIEWLSYSDVSKVCKKMDEIWESVGPGCPVIFEWIDFLTNSLFSFLGLDCLKIGFDSIDLGRGNSKAASAAELRDKRLQYFKKSIPTISLEQRAVSGWRPNVLASEKSESNDKIGELMGALLRYDCMVSRKVFLGDTHSCMICYETLAGSEFTHLSCKHAFCTGCLTEHVSVHVKEGSVERIVCPDARCKVPIEPSIIKGLLGEAEFERWEEVLLRKTLDQMKDVVYCPRKKCNTPVIEESDYLAQCTKCMYAFCTLCLSPWHPGTVCLTGEQKLAALEMRAKRASGADMALFIRKQMEYVNEQKTLRSMQKMGCKSCPGCKAQVSKTQGCNKMRCRCGVAFCFLCSKDITVEGYDHFSNSSCVLFSEDEIRAWERHNAFFNVGEDRYQENVWRIEARGLDVHDMQRAPCTYCGQQVFKEGKNNHMTCWSCKRQFCFLCKKALLKGKAGAHFGTGAGKCKQHT
jgi:E3 ubiquitin-protein ligase RNF14